MGGTFDPIHIGHLVAASVVHDELKLDQVIFIPAGLPWQKSGTPISRGEDRLQMVDLAISADARFTSSDIEIKRPGPTYAIDTVKELMADQAGHEYFWIVGADALESMPTWQNFKELTDLITIVAVNRNGAGQIKVDFDYVFVQIPEIQISATQIRNRVKANKPVAYLVADPVEKFITNSELYK